MTALVRVLVVAGGAEADLTQGVGKRCTQVLRAVSKGSTLQLPAVELRL
jgi:hypothetical protein